MKVYFEFHDSYPDEALRYGPSRPGWVPEKAFVIDMHAHSTYSDGILTPEQLVDWHISNGYSGMVLSDHNTMEGIERARDYAAKKYPDFIIIPGVEFTSLRTHLNIIGCKTLMPIPGMLWTTKKTIKRAIEHAHKENAVIQFNHRDWYPHKFYLSKDWYFKHGIDGFEEYNGFGFIDDEVEDFISHHKDIRPLFASAGTDVHDPASHRLAYTEIITNNHTIEGIITALQNGKTKVYYNEELEKERVKPEKGKKVKNLKLKQYLKNHFYIAFPGYALIMGSKSLKLLLLIIFVIGILISIFL